MDYKSSGVDVEKADKMVDWMKSDLKEPGAQANRVVSGIGGFAALFSGKFPEMKNPLLVSSTDGVGTKLIMGLENNSVSGLAQDLVGMCVNDMLCIGAEPLFFLDYFATSKLDEDQLKSFFTGLKKACNESGTALIGGETAELPGLYQTGHFDCAGFSVGVVDEEKAWSPEKVVEGDVFVGISSSGFHSNGYSLLRKVFGDDGGEMSEELLSPTKLYWPLVKALKDAGLDSDIRSGCHITGGGMDNITRALPKNLGVEIKDWELPKLFKVTQDKGNITRENMLLTFNCGMGFGFFIAKDSLNKFKEVVENTKDFDLVTSGEVVSSFTGWKIV